MKYQFRQGVDHEFKRKFLLSAGSLLIVGIFLGLGLFYIFRSTETKGNVSLTRVQKNQAAAQQTTDTSAVPVDPATDPAAGGVAIAPNATAGGSGGTAATSSGGSGSQPRSTSQSTRPAGGSGGGSTAPSSSTAPSGGGSSSGGGSNEAVDASLLGPDHVACVNVNTLNTSTCVPNP
jgi:hypothetical protein